MANELDQLLTVAEAAQLLALRPCTIRKWLYERRLPYVRLGRAVRLRKVDIERMVQENYSAAIKSEGL
jgi:excisionase family DNA binding protein